MDALRWLAATIVVAALMACGVQESTRTGGLIPPAQPASPAAPTVVTVGLEAGVDAGVVDDLSSAISGGRTSAVPTAEPDPPQSEPAPPVPEDDVEAALAVLAAAVPLDGFEEGLLGVAGPQGEAVWPVIVADTPAARQRGLMGVKDFAALGGYSAMVFIFEGDTSGAFWMRDTPLPLRITFVAASGSVVSGADMVPCLAPTPSDECDHYHPDGPYRIAIEHPLDPAFDIGLAAADLIEVTIE